MSYEKELAELRKEWKKSTDKYEEAIEDGYDVDADMWSHDVMEIERQIYVYEQASKTDELQKQIGILLGELDTLKINLDYYKKKTDEYEAKAKAFDEISDYWRTKDMLKLGHFVDKAIRKYAGEYESGEYDAKK